jgi:YVTN family beta-propeller protein
MRTAKVQETESILFRRALQENSKRRSTARLFGYGLLAILCAASGASAQSVTATVAVGTQPQAVAVSFAGDSLTVIDGLTNIPTTIPTGTNSIAVAVNPVTNKIYVANYNSNNVTVLDGATDTIIATVVGGGGA